MWACPACTYQNTASINACSMCEGARPSQGASSSASNSEAEQAGVMLAGVAGALFGGLLGAGQALEQRRADGASRGGSSVLGSALSGAMTGAMLGATAASVASAAASESGDHNNNAPGGDAAGSAAPQNMGDIINLFQAMLAPPGRSRPAGSEESTVREGREAAATRSFEELLRGLEQLRQAFVESSGGSNVPAVAKPDKIDSLPERYYDHGDSVDGGVEEGGEVCCVICLDALKPGDILKELPCNHACFHSRCISAWLSRGAGACPICRNPV